MIRPAEELRREAAERSRRRYGRRKGDLAWRGTPRLCASCGFEWTGTPARQDAQCPACGAETQTGADLPPAG